MAGTSYTRQSTITDGDLITASIFNNEYNQILNAFAYATSSTTGHQHDGSAGQGGNIAKIGDQDFKNKVVISAANNRIEFYSEVSNSPVEQVRIQDGLITPVTDSDVDLGTTSVRFKDAFVDSVTITNNIVVGGTVDGRDVATDGTKLDGIEASATADQTDAQIRAAVEAATNSNVFTDADHTKLNAIEASADVTDTTNVTAAGALMDSEVTNLAQVKAFDSSDYATAAQGTLAAAALPKSGGAMTGAITTNSTFDGVDIATRDGVLTTTTTTANAALPKAGGAMTGAITTNSTFDGRDVATDGAKLDGIEASATADQTAAEIRTLVEAASDSNVFTDADHTKLNALEASGDVTDTANVTAAGALMDSELTDIASVKALNQGVATGDSPTFAALTSTGEITANGGIALGDNDKATFGDSDDLKIYHSSSSFIREQGNGGLYIDSDGGHVTIRVNSSEKAVEALNDGAVNLYHDNSEKLATTATGIDVTGSVVADGLTVDGSGSNIRYDVASSNPHTNPTLHLENQNTTDSNVASLMLSAHNANGIGGSAYIYAQSETANQKGNLVFAREDGANTPVTSMKLSSSGDISFYEDTGSNEKLTWDASAESLNFADSGKATFGDDNDLQIYHDGSNSYIEDSGTGRLNVKANVFRVYNAAGDEISANFVQNGAAELYYDNVKKFETTSTGIDVTGVVTTDGITSSAPMTITTDSNAAQITLISTDDGANVGPLIDLTRDSASPAASDTLGRVRFRGEDANGDVTAYAQITGQIGSTSAGAVDGQIQFQTMRAGAQKVSLNLNATEAVFNESSEDYDFRVESNGDTHALFVEASSGNVGVGTSSPATLLDVDGTLTTNALVVEGGITEDAVTLTGTSTTIDISAATNFVHDLTGATTYTFSNPASTGNASSFTLKIIQDSTARAITWPASVDWAAGTAPTLTATNNGVDVFVFYTIDGGTTYYGFTAGQAMA